MNVLRNLGLFSCLWFLIMGCAVSNPMCQIVQHNPVLEKQGGVIIIADLCLQQDAIGEDNDCFIIDESKACAASVITATQKVLQENGIRVQGAISPFVCGALFDPDNSPKNVANNLTAPSQKMLQPFGVDESISADTEYVKALSTASTYAFQQAVMPKDEAAREKVQVIVDETAFKEAVALISQRTQASSLLFVNVTGTKISSGKKVAQGIGSFLVGMATGIATAGLGTGYFVSYMPGGKADGRLMGSALVDIDSGTLAWTNWVRTGGDPTVPEVTANERILKLLLRSVIHKPEKVLIQTEPRGREL